MLQDPQKSQRIPPSLPPFQSTKSFNPYGPDEIPDSADLYGIQGEKNPPRAVPTRSAAIPIAAISPSGSIDMNRANREAIAALPKVGSVLALQIVHQRESGGGFASMDDLCRRCGIKPHIRVAIEPFVSFSATNPSATTPPSPKKGRRVD